MRREKKQRANDVRVPGAGYAKKAEKREKKTRVMMKGGKCQRFCWKVGAMRDAIRMIGETQTEKRLQKANLTTIHSQSTNVDHDGEREKKWGNLHKIMLLRSWGQSFSGGKVVPTDMSSVQGKKGG